MTRKVWKFGCRWNEQGFPESETREVFKNFEIAFAYTYQVLDLKEGDLVAIADGQLVVAIGEAVSPPAPLDMFYWNDEQKNGSLGKYLGDGKVIGCRVKYHWLTLDKCFHYMKRGQFFHASSIELKVNSLFEELESKSEKGCL